MAIGGKFDLNIWGADFEQTKTEKGDEFSDNYSCKKMFLFNLMKNTPFVMKHAHSMEINCVSWTSGPEKMIVSVSDDHYLYVWKLLESMSN